MKLRIRDDAVRFRITLKELETLRDEGVVSAATNILGAAGPAGTFRYAVARDPDAEASGLELQPAGMILRLASADFDTLANAANEGAYIRREWTDDAGEAKRFMVFIEKDRPGSTCDKPDEWIYEEARGGQARATRPIGSAG